MKCFLLSGLLLGVVATRCTLVQSMMASTDHEPYVMEKTH